MLGRLLKPWYVYRPAQVFRRMACALRPPARGYAAIRTSWGDSLTADPARDIGRSLATTGIYDLAVSEVLVRLITPGDTFVDVGANIGYMSVLGSLACGPRGRVVSFEPHPALYEVLERNVASARARPGRATFETHRVALGERSGTASLEVPNAFEANDGLARIASSPTKTSIQVCMATFDQVLADASPVVLKLDVEGYEAQVLAGAARALAERRIRHVVFEEHAIETSRSARLLKDAGYRVFGLGWSLGGLRIDPAERPCSRAYEPPSFVASLDPGELVARCAPRGWRVLSAATMRRPHDPPPGHNE